MKEIGSRLSDELGDKAAANTDFELKVLYLEFVQEKIAFADYITHGETSRVICLEFIMSTDNHN